MTEKISRDRKKALLRQSMQIGVIQNNSENYNSQDEINPTDNSSKYITVTLSQLRPFDDNPRKHKNPKYNEIKESIRMRGLDFPPNITKRPNDNFYIISDGGNSRLQALYELYQETNDPQYYSITCLYKPYSGAIHCLIGHLAENDLRGDLTFIERALALQKIRQSFSQEKDSSLSLRKFSELLKDNGYIISHQHLSKMDRCIELLYPAIPNVLSNGLGKPQIEKLLQLFDKTKETLIHIDKKEFLNVWIDTLNEFDNDAFNIDSIKKQLDKHVSKKFNINHIDKQGTQAESKNNGQEIHEEKIISVANGDINNESVEQNILTQFGVTSSQSHNLSLSEQRKKRAQQNGIAFANTGCQPVDDIWQIFPAFDSPEKIKFEMFGLATDIANLTNLKPYLHTLGRDFSFTLDPLSTDEHDDLSISIHGLLSIVASDAHKEILNWQIDESLLLGLTHNPIITDELLVKIFRLIRITRQLRQHLRGALS
ncbi:hypothetical protein P375_11025 [Gallibacterium genomosp. 2]|uniref:Uncharacterized protein n=1 Tax=Gallibacterium genomosp. 2 TaxID=155517 RepID=A0A0A2XCB9_9PAST|nr:ParB family protein [Gallibacterium genomosp. 2]KGQ30051.1 hypothetical protein P375_11025 [Gallibacterium genomosp. 2]